MLSSVDSEPQATRLRNSTERSPPVPLQVLMSFLETPTPGVAPLWATLDYEQQVEVVARLARLIAKVAMAPRAATARAAEDPDDE
jgi:hypothetical protein